MEEKVSEDGREEKVRVDEMKNEDGGRQRGKEVAC